MGKTGQIIDFPSGRPRQDDIVVEAENLGADILSAERQEDPSSAPSSATALTAEKKAELMDEIDVIETALNTMYIDFDCYVVALEHKFTASSPEKPPLVDRLKLKLAYWLTDRPKPEAKPKVWNGKPTGFEENAKEGIAKEEQNLRAQMLELIAKREALVLQLDPATREELARRSEFNEIRDAVSRRASRCLPVKQILASSTTDSHVLGEQSNNGEKPNTHELSPERVIELLRILKTRFEDKTNMKNRHKGMKWVEVKAKLEARPEKLWSLHEMETTGGEPDVVGYENGEYIFFDCSTESPSGRRDLTYNQALEKAGAMGVEMLDGDQYLNKLQKIGHYDRNTWSWVLTPEEKRNPVDKTRAGVALCGHRHDCGAYGYGNNPDFHHGGRVFRGSLRV